VAASRQSAAKDPATAAKTLLLLPLSVLLAAAALLLLLAAGALLLLADAALLMLEFSVLDKLLPCSVTRRRCKPWQAYIQAPSACCQLGVQGQALDTGAVPVTAEPLQQLLGLGSASECQLQVAGSRSCCCTPCVAD
jgi:hypothetical protein